MTAVQSLVYTRRQHRQASKEIGINVKLDCVSYETLLDRRDSSQYDLLIWNVLVANTGDPENYLRENWHSTSANNTAGYSNTDVDTWLDELAETVDAECKKRADSKDSAGDHGRCCNYFLRIRKHLPYFQSKCRGTCNVSNGLLLGNC